MVLWNLYNKLHSPTWSLLQTLWLVHVVWSRNFVFNQAYGQFLECTSSNKRNFDPCYGFAHKNDPALCRHKVLMRFTVRKTMNTTALTSELHVPTAFVSDYITNIFCFLVLLCNEEAEFDSSPTLWSPACKCRDLTWFIIYTQILSWDQNASSPPAHHRNHEPEGKRSWWSSASTFLCDLKEKKSSWREFSKEDFLLDFMEISSQYFMQKKRTHLFTTWIFLCVFSFNCFVLLLIQQKCLHKLGLLDFNS